MIIELKHKAIKKYASQIPVSKLCQELIDEKRKNSFTINGMCYYINKYAIEYEKQFSFYAGKNAREKYSGNVFEIFVEYVFKTNEGNRFFGVANYKPIVGEDDYGVDGIGTSIVNCLPVTVQIKYRNDPLKYLTANEDRISNFYSNSLSKYLRDYSAKEIKNNMILITTCSGLNFKVKKEMFNDDIKVINRNDLKKFFDNCKGFWRNFYESIKISESQSHS